MIPHLFWHFYILAVFLKKKIKLYFGSFPLEKKHYSKNKSSIKIKI